MSHTPKTRDNTPINGDTLTPIVCQQSLGDPLEARVLRDTYPEVTTRALHVDRGDLPVGPRWTGTGTFQDCAQAATPKRDFRLSRPVLSSVDTKDFTARSV